MDITELPMGHTVRDLALLIELQAGHDPRVPLSLAGGERFAQALDDFDAKQVRIGWRGKLSGSLPMEAGILECCEDAALLQLAHACEPAAQELLRIRPPAAANPVPGP